MPIYEYKGKQFSSDHPLSPEEWKQTLAYFDAQQPVDSGLGSFVKATASQLAGPARTAVAGLQKVMPEIPPEEEEIAGMGVPGVGTPRGYEELAKQVSLNAREHPIASGAGSLVGGIANVVSGAKLARTPGIMGMFGTGTGQERYQEAKAFGEDDTTAMQMGIARGGLDAASVLLPAAKAGAPLLARMGMGAGGNIVANELDVAAQNALTDNKELQLEHFNPLSTGIAGVLGAVAGASVRAKPTADNTPKPKVEGEEAPKSGLPSQDEINSQVLPRAERDVAFHTERVKKAAEELELIRQTGDQKRINEAEVNLNSVKEEQAKAQSRLASVKNGEVTDVDSVRVQQERQVQVESARLTNDASTRIANHTFLTSADDAQVVPAFFEKAVDPTTPVNTLKAHREAFAKHLDEVVDDTVRYPDPENVRANEARDGIEVSPEAVQAIRDKGNRMLKAMDDIIVMREADSPASQVRGGPSLETIEGGQAAPTQADPLVGITDSNMYGTMQQRNPADLPPISKLWKTISGWQQFAQAWSHPFIQRTKDAIQAGQLLKQKVVNNLMWGTGHAAMDRQFGPFRRLSNVQSGDSFGHVLKKATWKEVNNVRKALVEGASLRRPYEETLAIWQDRLTPNEIKLFNTLTDMYKKAWDTWNDYARDRGFSAKSQLPYMNGWIPAVRRGDYSVMLSSKEGLPFHFETFRTREAANAFIKKVMADPDSSRIRVGEVVKNEDALSFQQRSEMMLEGASKLDEIFGTDFLGPELKRRLELMAEKSARAGGHHKHREGYTGYAGTRLFVDDKTNARDFRDSNFSYIEEMGEYLQNREIRRMTDGFLRNDVESHRNAQWAARVMVDQATSRLENQKGLLGQAKKATNAVDTIIDEALERSVNYFLRKFGKEWHGNIALMDRALGLGGQLLYIPALMVRPAFWASQVLTSPLAFRHVLREGNVADVIRAGGKGMIKVLSGGDQPFRKFISDLAMNTNVLHPNLVNDVTRLGADFLTEKGAGILQKIVRGATGAAPSEIADSLSRYMTAALMYEHGRAKGLSGKPLRDFVVNGVNTTMVTYSITDKPTVFAAGGRTGQQLSPLTTFTMAQFNNMIADLLLIKRNPKDVASYMPFMFTMFSSAVLGGTIAVPLVAEYEIIRKVLGLEEKLPSAVEWLMKNKPDMVTPEQWDFVTHGVPSASTGMDIGASLRYQTPFGHLADPNVSLWDVFPIIKSAIDKSEALTILSKAQMGKSVPIEDQRWAAKQLNMVVGGRFAIDEYYNEGVRPQVLDRSGQGLVPLTEQERVASFLGTSTMDMSKTRLAKRMEDRKQKLKRERATNSMRVLTDAIQTNDNAKAQQAIEELIATGATSEQINRSVNKMFEGRMIDYETRKLKTLKDDELLSFMEWMQ